MLCSVEMILKSKNVQVSVHEFPEMRHGLWNTIAINSKIEFEVCFCQVGWHVVTFKFRQVGRYELYLFWTIISIDKPKQISNKVKRDVRAAIELVLAFLDQCMRKDTHTQQATTTTADEPNGNNQKTVTRSSTHRRLVLCLAGALLAGVAIPKFWSKFWQHACRRGREGEGEREREGVCCAPVKLILYTKMGSEKALFWAYK